MNNHTDLRLFLEQQQKRHPELLAPVTWSGFRAIAAREGVRVYVVPLSRPARFVRLGRKVCIQINRDMPPTARARFGMHELCHFWRDDNGEDACYHAEDEWMPSDSEDFAELFAWLCTHPGPLPGLRWILR